MRFIDRDVLRLPTIPDDANDLAIRVVLLDEGKLDLAEKLVRHAQVVEQFGGDGMALVLPGENGLAALRIGLPPHHLVRHAAGGLDIRLVLLHEHDVLFGQRTVVADLEFAALFLLDDAVGASDLFSQFVEILHRVVVRDHLVRGQDEQGLGPALVQVALRVDEPTNHAIRGVRPLLAEAPHGDEGKAVVAVR